LTTTTSLVVISALCCLSGLVRFPFLASATTDLEGTDFLNEALIAHAHDDSVIVNARQPETYDHADPVSEALADHGDTQFLVPKISSKMTEDVQRKRIEALKEASWNIANKKAREEHPWDDLPEGMPTRDGRMISPVDLVSGMKPQPPNQNYALSSVRTSFSKLPQFQRQPVPQHGDTMDPMVMADLDSVFDAHEGPQDEQHIPATARASRKGPVPAAARGDGSAPGHGGSAVHQGFVAGDHLRVQPKEYYHEMKRFLPSSDGRLISPFEWFQTGGRGYTR
jgi:hypothetical protein